MLKFSALKVYFNILVLTVFTTSFFHINLKSQPYVTLLWEKVANVKTLKFTPDGQFLVTGGSINSCYPYTCGQIKVWNVSDSTLLRTITNNNIGLTNEVTTSSDGQIIYSANGSIYCVPNSGCYEDRPGQFKIALSNGNILNSNTGLGSGIYTAIDLSPDGTLLALATAFNNNGDIKILNASDLSLVRTLDGHDLETNGLRFTPNGQILISGGHDGLIKFWNVANGQLIRSLTHGTYTNGGWDVRVAVTSDGMYAASAGQGYNMTVKIWRISDGLLIHTLNVDPATYGGYNTIRFSPNNIYLAAGLTTYGSNGLGWYGRLQFWRVSDGVLVQEYIDTLGSPTSGGIRTLGFSNSGNNFFAYSVNNRLRVAHTNLNLVSPTAVEINGSGIPENFILYNNYPNPFNPETKIKFAVPHETNIKLSIYDVSGRLVDVPVNSNYKPGIYEISWNGAEYTSGAYFYRLEINNYSVSKKMILAK